MANASEVMAVGAQMLDPMKPKDILLPPGMESVPPICPACKKIRLEAVRQNDVGDVLFECLSDGYMAAWRKATSQFERPKMVQEGPWMPPTWGAAEPAKPVEVEQPKAPAPAAPAESGVTALDAALLSGLSPEAMAVMIRKGEVKVFTAPDGGIRVPVSELMRLGGK